MFALTTSSLVPEQVAEHQEPGAEHRGDLRQPGLVDLEEALVATLLDEGGRHAPAHVGAGAVRHRLQTARPRHVAQEPSRRGLAVSARNQCAALPEGARQPGHDLGINALSDEAGERGAAAQPETPADPSGDFSSSDGSRASHCTRYDNRFRASNTAPSYARYGYSFSGVRHRGCRNLPSVTRESWWTEGLSIRTAPYVDAGLPPVHNASRSPKGITNDG